MKTKCSSFFTFLLAFTTIIVSSILAAGPELNKIELHPIYVRAGTQFSYEGQYATATISNHGPEIDEGSLLLVISGNGQTREKTLKKLKEGESVLVELSLPAIENPSAVTLSLLQGDNLLDSKTIQTCKPEPFTFYFMPSCHLCFGWITGESTDHWGAATVIEIAIGYLDKYPNYAFNIEAMWFLKDYLDKHPENRPKIERYLKEGRLYAGGWTTPMQNIAFPEDETYVRQVTMAQWWYAREFGLKAPVVIDFDAAANRFQTAQIFSKAGIESYYRGRYGRGFKYGKTPDTPGDPHQDIIGPEGSQITTFSPAAFLHGGYCTTPLEGMIERFAQAGGLNSQIAADVSRLMGSTVQATGIRIHGGTVGGDQSAPANPSLAVSAWNTAVAIPEVKIAIVPEFFEAERQAGLKVVDTKLPGQDVFWARLEFPAWLTSRYMWRAATCLLTAEKAATLDTLLNGTIYPRAVLHDSWDHIVFLSHHEQMWNNPLENYQYGRGLLEESATTAEIIIRRSLERLSHRIALADQGVPVVVWNLCNWNRRDFTEAVLSEEVPLNATSLFDSERQPIPCEIVRDGSMRTLRFVADVPAMGYSLYYLQEGNTSKPPAALLSGEDFIENEFYRVEVDHDTGCVTSIYDKELDQELLASHGNEIIVLDDPGQDPKLAEAAWGAQKLTGKSWQMLKSSSKVSIDRNPFSVSITVRGDFFGENDDYFGDFREQVITLWAGIKRVNFITKLHWQDRWNCQLRLNMPFALQDPQITYDTQYGVINYDPNDPGLAGQDEPSRQSFRNLREVSRWTSLYDRAKDISVCMTVPALLNYFEGGTVSTLLLRRVGFEAQAMLPLAGLHTFRYSITSGRGDWRVAKAYRFGREQYQGLEPLRTVFPTRLVSGYSLNEQLLPPRGSLVETGAEDVVLTVLKMAEQGYSVVARAYEAEGKPSKLNLAFTLPVQGPARVHVQFPQKIDFVEEVNLIEEPVAPLDLNALKVGIDMKPWEIKTLRLGFSWGAKVLVQCPFCNQTIHWGMTICPSCGKELPKWE